VGVNLWLGLSPKHNSDSDDESEQDTQYDNRRDFNNFCCDYYISKHLFLLCLVGMPLFYQWGVSGLVGVIPLLNVMPSLSLRNSLVSSHC
jgi:hypothetical protein